MYHVFTYAINNAVSSNKWQDDMSIMIWKGCRKKQVWSHLRYYASIWLEKLR
jgi:hypothetical protein